MKIEVKLVKDNGNWWKIGKCPICGQTHFHCADLGIRDKELKDTLGLRFPHCHDDFLIEYDDNFCYELVEGQNES